MNAVTALSLAHRFREERLRLGRTQAEVAAAAGVSTVSLYRFERSGAITLDRLLAIAATLGISVELTAASAGGGSALTPDPRVTGVRQRGLRHAKPPASPARATSASSPAPQAGTRTRAPSAAARPATGTHTAPTPRAVDSRAASAALQQHRDAIVRLVGTIVNNRLDNYAAFTPTQNVMRAQHVDEGGQAAFFAAVEGELGRLNAQTCASFGVDPQRLASWQQIWRPELGIVDPAA